MGDDSEEIREVLTQIGALTELVRDRGTFHDEMRSLKVDIRSYVDDSRVSIGLVKSDVAHLRSDVRDLQTSIEGVRTDMNDMKVELAPLVELKRYVAGQVMRYSGVGFLAVLSVLMGINMLP
jgi:hypothetical protein